MKPSERIIEIVKSEITNDWINGGGNRHSREAWDEMIHNDEVLKAQYTITGIMKYLDEQGSKTL